MTRPLVKPIRPEFSSGPCAKRPDWSLQALTKATVARSHRHKIAKQKLENRRHTNIHAPQPPKQNTLTLPNNT